MIQCFTGNRRYFVVISKLTTVFKLENGVSTLVSFYKRVNRRFGLRHLRRYVVTEPFSPSSIEVHSHFSDVLQNSRTALDLTGTNGTKTKNNNKKIGALSSPRCLASVWWPTQYNSVMMTQNNFP